MAVQFLAATVFLSFVALSGCVVVNSITISDPIVGLEGQNVTIYCISSASEFTGTALQLRVGSVELPASKRTYLEANATHRVVVIHNLDRQQFTTLDQPGNQGMPLVCGFAEFTSTVSNLTVIYNDFVVFASSPRDTITVVLGESLQIPLNVSANPAELDVSRVDGGMTSNAITITSDYLIISQAGRDIAGRYNITVSNLAGVTSLSFNIEVQFAAMFNFQGDSYCRQTMSNTQPRVTALECFREAGTDVELDCSFEANPAGTLSVTFNGTALSANTPSNVVLNGTSIFITGLSSANLGEYKCSVTNMIDGTATISTLSLQLTEGELPTTSATTASATTAGARSIHLNLVLPSFLLLAIVLLW